MASSGSNTIDLVGAPFSVLERVFTSLARKLGIKNIEFVELYDIEPWAVDHLNPLALVFCFVWAKDHHKAADFNDPMAEKVWFANQLQDDSCATHAILNIALNSPDIDVGDALRQFREDTDLMSSTMKGLAISNHPNLRQTHNSFARPADIRGSRTVIANTTFKAEAKRKREEARAGKPPPAKKPKTTSTPKKTDDNDDDENVETYHFIGYVPSHGKCWEMDGLKSGPLEVGELASSSSTDGWMDVVRPALRMKMKKYGGAAEGGNIRFSLLAIVRGSFEKASDDFEYLRKEKVALERQLGDDWRSKVESELDVLSNDTFESVPKRPFFTAGWAQKRLYRDLEIQRMDQEDALVAWRQCIMNAISVKATMEEEISKAIETNTEHAKRVHDWEPLFEAYLRKLHSNGLLNALLDRDEHGRKISSKKRKVVV
ncbi:ubiquitin C-terminal hydrolase [Flagelloscypha sp. PMI_526]|nr:ubiquitin C-terminal hydrolase [Flagelloscypha sp. PMI_526]